MKTYVIAEAGVNHNGELALAFRLIDAAKEIGANCIKFQTFKAQNLVTCKSPKAKYQLALTDNNESQYEMLKKVELSYDDFEKLFKYCKKKKIDFLSTPYNIEDVDFLDNLGVPCFKIASAQITEIPFLKYVARKGKGIILSSGMANLAEVFDAVQAIREERNIEIAVLQCTTNYPSRIEDANLLSMNSIKAACKVKVGYSDHIAENMACFVAVALGAEIIEKHFTLDCTMAGPDHSSSLDIDNFRSLIEGIRKVELALGSGIKTPSETEMKNAFAMKRSLIAKEDMPKGSIITEELVSFKRPANGLPPKMIVEIIGKTLAVDLKKDDSFQYNSINW